MTFDKEDKRIKEELYCEMLEDAKKITGRDHSQAWEVEVVKKFIIPFKLSTAAGLAAEAEHWFGIIHDNYIVSPYGLVNYLFEIYSKYVWIKDIMSIRPDFKRPKRPIEEFNYVQNHNFNSWLDSDYFYARAINGQSIDIVEQRRDDLILLRKKGIQRWKDAEEYLKSNSNLLQPFLKKI